MDLMYKYAIIKALLKLAPFPLIDGASSTSSVIIVSTACVFLRSHSPLTHQNAQSFSCMNMNSLPSHLKSQLSLTTNEVAIELRLALRQIEQSSCEPKTPLAIKH